MAHFAQLDENNLVLQVIVVHNNEVMLDDVESEDKGVLFCKSLFGQDTRWKQTSYNAKIRKNYAVIGCTYDPNRDAFIPLKPYNSWVLNEDTCAWGPPTPMPDDGNRYIWDENTTSWVQPE